jgi:hypothetical protein
MFNCFYLNSRVKYDKLNNKIDWNYNLPVHPKNLRTLVILHNLNAVSDIKQLKAHTL